MGRREGDTIIIIVCQLYLYWICIMFYDSFGVNGAASKVICICREKNAK